MPRFYLGFAMSTPTNAKQAAEQAALGPKRVRVGNQEVEQFSPKELREQAIAEKADSAASKPHFGIRFTKLIPPGGG